MSIARGHTKSAASREPWRIPWRWILAGTAVILGLAALHWLPTREWVDASRGWIEDLGWAGPLAFLLIYVVAGLLLVPGAALTMGAGAFFGVGRGMVLVPLAATTVAAAAFLIARHVARERVERALRGHRNLQAANRAISRGGWRIVLLFRLSPLVPFGLANYSFGLTRVGFWAYLGASFVGMLPGTILYLYLGHLGAEGASPHGKSAWEWGLLASGFLATATAVFWISRTARAMLERRTGAGRGK